MSKHSIEIDFNDLDFNLYEILNIPDNSSIKKIKKAYRRLIIKFHPDKNAGNKKYEDKLKKITLAYSHLKMTMIK